MQFFAILRDSFREAVDGFVIYVMLALSAITLILIASMSFEPAKPEDAYPKIVQKFPVAFHDRGNGRDQVGFRVGSGIISQTKQLPVEFAAADVQKMDAAGAYKFRLTAKPAEPPKSRRERKAEEAKKAADKKENGEKKDDKKDDKKDEQKDDKKEPDKKQPGKKDLFELKDNTDWFRALVLSWSRSEAAEMKGKVLIDNETREVIGPVAGDHTPEEGTQVIEVSIPSVDPSELNRVTDDMMTDFVKNQFLVHAAIDQVTVRRVSGVKEPEYTFEVETRGGSAVRGWPHTTQIFFGAVTVSRDTSLGLFLFGIEDQVVNGIGALVTLLISVILTAFFIPNMIRKGSMDLIVAKPISRGKLLLYKYIGGLTFILLLSAFTIGGSWVILGVRSGYWNPEFLLVIPILTFTFAILYSLSTLVAILTRSAIAAILITIGFMFVLWLVGTIKSNLDVVRSDDKLKDQVPNWVYVTVDGLNNCLPRYKDLDKLTTKILSESLLSTADIRQGGMDRLEYPSWGATIGVSVGFIALMLLLSYWRFATRDG